MPEQNQNMDANVLTVDQMIGAVPGKFLYSGITMIAIVFSTIIALSYFIKFPDKISSTGILTSEQPPIEFSSRTDGFIDSLFFKDGDLLQKGDFIVRINNTTDEAQLTELKNWMEEFQNIKSDKQFLKLRFPDNLQLGSLQSNYASIQLKYEELLRHLNKDFIEIKIQNIREEMLKLNQLNESITKEKSIFLKELQLAKNDNQRSLELKKQGLISEVEFEKNQSQLLQKERQYENLQNGIIRNNITINQLDLQISVLDEDRYQMIENSKLSISEVISGTTIDIQNWERQFYVEAPISGILTLSNGIVLKKTVQPIEVLGLINPSNKANSYVSAFFPVRNIGKIEKGHEVILRFDAFPYKEFGSVFAKVNEIAPLPIKTNEGATLYEIKMNLPDMIQTDYGEQIPFSPNMTTSVDIITEERSILSRIFDQIISLVKTNQ